MSDNVIIPCSHYGIRKSVSMDIALFGLFVEHCKGRRHQAVEDIKLFMRDNWGESNLSRKAQRYCLSKVCRPVLGESIFKYDGHLQESFDFG